MKEQKKYEAIKSLADHGGNKGRAVIELGVTRRTVDRMIAGYKKKGKAFFSHGNKGRTPHTALPEDLRRDILFLYNSKYHDCSYELFTELLASNEGIHVSVGTVRNILMGVHILSPKARRKTVRRVKKELEAKRQETVSKKENKEIDRKLIMIEDAHPRRPRSANFGEELQMDASVFPWFGGVDSHLHAAIDDAAGTITGAYFDWQETLHGYYNVFHQTIIRHGIPYRFRTDRRTVFEYRLTGSNRAEEDTYTQFAYACKQLGVHIQTTSIPQGKGRIERLFQTLQGRLPILLRLAGINTIEAANGFLSSYIDEFNAQFALDCNAIPSVFEKQPSKKKINLTLAVLAERAIDAGHSVKFEKKYYKTIGKDGGRVCLAKGTKGLVVKAFDGNMFFSAADTVMPLVEIPERERVSKEFSATPVPREKKPQYIPPPSHPWRTSSFGDFCAKMRHRDGMPAA
jgi:transposase